MSPSSLPFFSNILLKNINNTKKISILLNDDEIKYIEELVYEYPEIFDKIGKNINDIMEDKEIGIHDFPQIICIISTIYNSNLIHEMMEKVDIINIVQYTIDSILDCGIIPLSEIELSIVKQIIDSSISLLRMNIGIIKKEEDLCCATFWKNGVKTNAN